MEQKYLDVLILRSSGVAYPLKIYGSHYMCASCFSLFEDSLGIHMVCEKTPLINSQYLIIIHTIYIDSATPVKEVPIKNVHACQFRFYLKSTCASFFTSSWT
jgi:hypothetical protein